MFRSQQTRTFTAVDVQHVLKRQVCIEVLLLPAVLVKAADGIQTV